MDVLIDNSLYISFLVWVLYSGYQIWKKQRLATTDLHSASAAKEIVTAAKYHWRMYCNIDEKTVGTMGRTLSQELITAVQDGKSTTVVTGSNLRNFADQRAADNGTETPHFHNSLRSVASLAMWLSPLFLAMGFLVQLVTEFSKEVRIPWAMVELFFLLGIAIAFTIVYSARLPKQTKPNLVLSGIFALVPSVVVIVTIHFLVLELADSSGFILPWWGLLLTSLAVFIPTVVVKILLPQQKVSLPT